MRAIVPFENLLDAIARRGDMEILSAPEAMVFNEKDDLFD